MKTKLLLILLIFLSRLNAQKVGVVLSGGGAAGSAHVGVLKSLEENKIPIDNIIFYYFNFYIKSNDLLPKNDILCSYYCYNICNHMSRLIKSRPCKCKKPGAFILQR